MWRVEGADGVKTGFTKAAGRILVSSAARQDRRIIAVTIDDGDDWNDHARLLEEGFSGYQMKTLVSKGTALGEVEVVGGGNRRVEIVAAEDFSFPVAKEERPQTVLGGQGFVYAPVTAGADAGIAYVLIEGKAVGKIPVVYGATVEQEPEEKGFFERLFRR